MVNVVPNATEIAIVHQVDQHVSTESAKIHVMDLAVSVPIVIYAVSLQSVAALVT